MEDHQVPDSLHTEETDTFKNLNPLPDSFSPQNEGDHTHAVERFDLKTSTAAVARTGPEPRARRDSSVFPRETRKPRPLRTEL